MKLARALVSAAVAVGLTALASWHFEWSFEKAALLAPVIVVAVGVAVSIAVLWVKVVWESLGRRATRRPADTRSDTGETRA